MEIIDFHAHIYPEKIAEKAVKSVGNFYGIEMGTDGGTADTLIKNGKWAGVTRFLVQSVATTANQVCSINDFIAAECQKHSELSGFGTLHPDMEKPQEEINRMKALGLKGVKFHPDTQKFNMDDERMFPIYDALRGDLPVLMHCGDYRYSYSHPERLARVLDNFPDLTVIGAHFGGWTLWDLALEYLKDRKCYVDSSSSIMFLGKTRSRELIRLYGAQRVLYGTDFPMWKQQEEIDRVLSLGLSNEELELIFSGNAKKILD